MPSWVSNKGIWTPARERAYIPPDLKKGREEGYIYDGPDRQATALLESRGVDHIGNSAERDPDVIRRARDLNMTVPQFLKLNEPPTPETVASQEKQKTTVVQHALPRPKEGVQPQGGRAPDQPVETGGNFGAPVGGAPAPVPGQSGAF